MEQLFKSSADAIMFALRFSSQQYAETPMSKMMKRDGRRSSGKGLVGLDGAGQAGMILQKLENLDELERACIVARYTDRIAECPCCRNPTASEEYRNAINTLASWAERNIENVTSVPRIRFAIVQEFFERRRSVGKVADDIGMPRSTAYDQRARIWPRLTELDKKALGKLDTQLAGLLESTVA